MTGQQTRMTRDEASAYLGVTVRTVDRRIRSGQLEAVREDGHVYIVMATNGHLPGQQTGHVDGRTEKVSMPTIVGHEACLERITHLEELVDHFREARDREVERYSEVMSMIRTGHLALPASTSRSWWRFWSR